MNRDFDLIKSVPSLFNPPHEFVCCEMSGLALRSIWRVLRGPNSDWPLAVLDYTTVDPDKDSTSNDILNASSVGENKLLHASPKHRWYYLSDQNVHELLIFRNVDSKGARARMPTSPTCTPFCNGNIC